MRRFLGFSTTIALIVISTICFHVMPASAQEIDVSLYGDVASFGVGLFGKTTGVIVVSGLPATSRVVQAYLYWTDIGSNSSFFQPTLNGIQVFPAGGGGATFDACGGAANNFVYRADVTQLVNGNGNYTIAGLPNDPVDKTQGASLVVFYSDPSMPRKRVIIHEIVGAIQTSGLNFSDSILGVVGDNPLTNAHVTLIVGDGEKTPNGDVKFNGSLLASNPFIGTNGSKWDVLTYDVTSLGLNNPVLSITLPANPDCLLWVADVFSFTVPPEPDFESYCSPNNQTILSGGKIFYTCKTNFFDGLNNPVHLSCLAGDFTCDFDPNDFIPNGGTSVDSELTLTANPGASIGMNGGLVQGDSGALNHSDFQSVLVVNPVCAHKFDFGSTEGFQFFGTDWKVVSIGSGFALQGTAQKKAYALSPDCGISFGGYEADVQILTPDAKVSLLLWDHDKKNLVELQINVLKGKLLLKQKGNGLKGKGVAKRALQANVNIHLKITFDGTNFRVFADNEFTPVITMPAVAPPSGTNGIQIKPKTTVPATATITNIIAYLNF